MVNIVERLKRYDRLLLSSTTVVLDDSTAGKLDPIDLDPRIQTMEEGKRAKLKLPDDDDRKCIFLCSLNLAAIRFITWVADSLAPTVLAKTKRLKLVISTSVSLA